MCVWSVKCTHLEVGVSDGEAELMPGCPSSPPEQFVNLGTTQGKHSKRSTPLSAKTA
jgi:hypothetical protein